MMRRLVTAAARLSALACAILFVILTPVALLLFNVEQHLLSPKVYQQALVQLNLYERFPLLAADQLAQQIRQQLQDAGSGAMDGLPRELEKLSPSDYEMVIRDILPPAWLQAQTESVLDQLFGLLDPNTPTASLTISLAELKARVGGEIGVGAVKRLIRSLPPCTDDQLKDLDSLASGAEIEGVPICRPPEETLDDLTPSLQDVLSRQASKIPPELVLNVSLASGPTAYYYATFQQARAAVRWSPALPVALILLVALFGVRSFRGLLAWWGIPLTLAGLIGLGLVLVAWLGSYVAAFSMIPNMSLQFSPNVSQAAFDLARRIVHAVLVVGLGREAWLVWLIGYLMLLSAYFMKPKRVPEPSGGPALTAPGDVAGQA